MKRFFRAIVPALAAVLVFVLGATRCTSVDDTLGQNFIPPYQHMKLRIDTLTPIYNGDELLKTYLMTNDSVPSSNLGLLMVGNMVDPVLGRVKASAMTDFFPEAIGKYTLSEATEEDEDEEDEDAPFFGYMPEADSIFIELIVNDIKGDNTVDQIFNIYELRDSLRRDSMYYFATPIEDRANFVEPLFTFKIGTDVAKNTMIRRKLEPTTSGRGFMRRLVEAENKVYTDPGHEFHKKFYGLYIAPADGGPENAALYEFNLRDLSSETSTSTISSALFLWAHNHDENNPTQVLDTMAGQFSFSDTHWVPNPNLNVNRVRFEYPAEIAASLNNTLSPALETIYIQGLGGVASYLRFTDDMLERLEALKTQDGVQHSEMVINDARIYFPMADPATENMDAAPVRLGMYYTYGQPRREVGYPYWFTSPYYYMTRLFGPVPIEDYMYYVENNPQSQSSSSGLRYGGYINRTKGFYEMNITGYMTMLQAYPRLTPKEIWLGPEINTRSIDYTMAALNGSRAADNPIKIVITYTLIK